MSPFNMDDYVTVPERITEFRDKYPKGCLQPANKDHPYTLETVDGHTFIVVVAAAYRDSQDPRPGIGMAWEPYPGKTQFTRDSELQNAETSAWGRAIVAVLAADTKRGVATAEEVRNRVEGSPQTRLQGLKSELAKTDHPTRKRPPPHRNDIPAVMASIPKEQRDELQARFVALGDGSDKWSQPQQWVLDEKNTRGILAVHSPQFSEEMADELDRVLATAEAGLPFEPEPAA